MFALMPWTRRSALIPRVDIADDFDKLINRLVANFPTFEEAPERWGLTMEEKDKEFLVRMELPGFEPAEVKVELIGDRLTVEAEHKEPEGKTEDRNGRTYAHAKRTITLPPGVEFEKMEATFRNGVLEVHVPRAPEAVGRRIEVKS
jgi:HSP20 family protein